MPLCIFYTTGTGRNLVETTVVRDLEEIYTDDEAQFGFKQGMNILKDAMEVPGKIKSDNMVS